MICEKQILFCLQGALESRKNTQNPRLRSPKPRDRHGLSFSQWNFAKKKKKEKFKIRKEKMEI